MAFGPKGESLRWTAAEIARQAVIAPEDARQAIAAWNSVAPARYASLILAGLSGSKVRFDPDRMLYMAGGVTIPQRSVKQAVNSAIDVWGRQLQATTRTMLAGNLTIGDWQTLMAEKVKAMHTAVSIIGNGGVTELTREDALFLEGQMRFQYERLQRFSIQVERGEVTGTAVEQRASMYADSANPVYEDVRRAAAEDNGMDEERRILGASEHCPDCIDGAAREWQPLGTLPQIGDSACRWNCKCHFEYRNSGRSDSAAAASEKPPDGKGVFLTQDPNQARSLSDALHGTFG